MSERTTIQEQKDFYDAYWLGLKPISSYKVKRVQWILDVLLQVRKQYTGDTKLLDLGCGDGRLVPLWQAVSGAQAYGLDLSPQAMQIAAEKFPDVHYTAGDATHTPYADEMFDMIICQEVLEHIEVQQDLVREAARILKTGGSLILTTPNKYYFDRRDGGNYSQQPIEQLVNKQELYSLLSSGFVINSYTTLIYAKGDTGPYRLFTGRFWLAVLRRLGLENAWKDHLLRKGYGVHMAVVCTKK